MSRFKFRLQRVLDMRERREREMTLLLASAQRAAAEARRTHEELESACSDGNEQIAEAANGQGSRPAGELQYLGVVLDHLRAQARAAGDERMEADAKVELSTNAVVAAARARHVLEQLRGQQHEAWYNDGLHADQKAMDAIALSQYVLRTTRKAED